MDKQLKFLIKIQIRLPYTKYKSTSNSKYIILKQRNWFLDWMETTDNMEITFYTIRMCYTQESRMPIKDETHIRVNQEIIGNNESAITVDNNFI